MKAQYIYIFIYIYITIKEPKEDVFPANSTLFNLCGYPEEEISRSKEKQGGEKDAICVTKVQEGKEGTIFTREKEEINVIGEIKKIKR